MRYPFPEPVERARVLGPTAIGQSRRGDDFGAFAIRRKSVNFIVIASSGSREIPWEHVSVSTKIRPPTWDEMCWVKDLFFEPEEIVMQLHPPRSRYVNYHPFCLHLWRPLDQAIPLPPTVAVGPMACEAP